MPFSSILLRQQAEHRAASEVSRLILHAFLVGKTDDFQMKRQFVSAQFSRHGNAEKNSERTVVFPRVAHRVEVRADNEGLGTAFG
jgi:hypothetical protein